MGDEVGEVFQRETRYHRNRMRGYVLDWDSRPPSYKIYADAPVFKLPSPEIEPLLGAGEPGGGGGAATADLWNVVGHRRSLRQFTEEPVTAVQLSRLLWASAGVTRLSSNQLYRATPSAGALYPIETYVVVNRVVGIPAGLYHYRTTAQDAEGVLDPTRGHCLEQLRALDLGAAVSEAALDQGIAERAAVVFIWTAIFGRSAWKYRQRAYRYVYLDAGHIAAHVSLAAVALGLGSCQIAAFFDDEMDRLVGVDGQEESTLYLTVVGKAAQ